jgi:eukaryotic-like serine/threonine-protein kinase
VLQTLKWFDEAGNALKIASKSGIFRGVRVSPNGNLIATMCDEPDMNICLVHEDGSLTRINERPLNYGPVWSPDGNSVTFGTHRYNQEFGIAIKDVEGKMAERTLVETEDGLAPTSWSPDGKELLVERTNERGKRYLAVLQLVDLKFRDLVTSPADLRDGRFSPDGKWVSYYSNESGHDEIYVCAYEDPARKFQISRDGGRAARWGPDGLSLYFLSPEDAILRVQLSVTRNSLVPGTPETLFRPDILRAPYDVESFDVLASKRRLLINTTTLQQGPNFVLVTSWRRCGWGWGEGGLRRRQFTGGNCPEHQRQQGSVAATGRLGRKTHRRSAFRRSSPHRTASTSPARLCCPQRAVAKTFRQIFWSSIAYLPVDRNTCD